MKYNININQLALFETALDMQDSAILDYLYFICSSKNKKIVAQRIDDWTWVNYKALMVDMPLLRIKAKSSISKRIKKIESEGFISTKLLHGDRLFVKTNSKMDELFVKTNGTVLDDEHYRSSKRTYNSTKDNPTKLEEDFSKEKRAEGNKILQQYRKK